jgi:hypothetical protein
MLGGVGSGNDVDGGDHHSTDGLLLGFFVRLSGRRVSWGAGFAVAGGRALDAGQSSWGPPLLSSAGAFASAALPKVFDGDNGRAKVIGADNVGTPFVADNKALVIGEGRGGGCDR